MLRLDIEQPDFAPMLRALEMDAHEKLRLLLDMVGRQTVDYLRSLTGEMRPPARRGGANRQAHPGHWADVTGQLANSYEYDVEARADGATLTLRNGAEYAAELEAREGFFVLSGVTEPGGPVDTALRRVIPQVAPGWTVS